MNVALIMTAVRHGATVANYTEVIALHKDEGGKLQSATVRDNLTGQSFKVKAKVSIYFANLWLIISDVLLRAS